MYKVASSFDLAEGSRLHVRVEQRYITLFRHRGVLSAIDAICHHAGGPLTLGPIRDIEELGMAVVLCPWHKFMVSIDGGIKAYQVRSRYRSLVFLYGVEIPLPSLPPSQSS